MLTDKQKRFCEEYLIDLNATQAAIRAGYSEKTASAMASRLFTNVNIQEEISKLQNELSQETKLSVQWVLDNLKELVERCMQKHPVMRYNRTEKCMEQVINEDGEGVWQFDSSGANRALELLGKHLGLFDERVKHSGEMNLNVKFKEFDDDE